MTPSPETARDVFLRPFLAEGFRASEPALLFPSDLFIDLSGEDLGKRLFLTSNSEGQELCLRPELTIPVCLEHLAQGEAERRADYVYYGRAFRQKTGTSGEFWQGGVESFGEADSAAADARLLALAIDCAKRHGAPRAHIRLGDVGLFRAVLDALSLPVAWKRKLARDFGRSTLIGADLAALHRLKPVAKGHSGLINALGRADRDGARALVADLLALGGLNPVGGRGVDEIAARFLERAERADGASSDPEHLEILERFLAIEAAPAMALLSARDILAPLGGNVVRALDAFETRLKAFEAAGIAIGDMVFSAAFGRTLDYYSGLVFELTVNSKDISPPIIGGGRYDQLMTLLGAHKPVPAIGFSVWIERLPEGLS